MSFFLKRYMSYIYYIDFLSAKLFYLFPKAAPPTLHTTFLFIPCLKNKYPKGIELLCRSIHKCKRYSWKHYLKCCLKGHLENILLVHLVGNWISRGCPALILPEEQFDLTIFRKSTENGESWWPWRNSLVSQYLSHRVTSLWKTFFDSARDPSC